MNAHYRQEERRRIAEQAAEWLSALEEGTASKRGFFAWLTESPIHVEETLLMSALSGALGRLSPEIRQEIEEQLARDKAQAINVVPLEPAAANPEPNRALFKLRRMGLAAAILAASAMGFWLLRSPANEYVTEIGEQRTLELEDGSVVHLNTDSRLAVNFSPRARDLRLLEGEALFTVRRDAKRPFRVQTPEAVIRALGTQFNVYRRAAGTKVSVLEGRVQVSGEAAASLSVSPSAVRNRQEIRVPSTKLSAGEETNVTPQGRIEDRRPVDLSRAVAWRQNRLVFHDDTVADIAEEFNRYNQHLPIEVEDGRAAVRRVSGIFEPNGPKSFARAVSVDPALEAVVESNRIVIRSRP